MPIRGVNEIILEVADLEASEHFYVDVLGLPVTFRWEGELWKGREAVWVMVGDQTRIGLWKPQLGISRCRGGVHVHFAISIDEADYDGVVQRLRDQGQTVDEVAWGDGTARSAYIVDPDQHIVEFWTYDITLGDATGIPRAASEGVYGLPPMGG